MAGGPGRGHGLAHGDGSVSASQAAVAAVAGLALYAGHHVGDYWVQTDTQARLKGAAGWVGRRACAEHVLTYVGTQAACLWLAAAVLDPFEGGSVPATLAALAVSGVTHWLADRREHGAVWWLARLLPWKRPFLTLGDVRPGVVQVECTDSMALQRVMLDRPVLGTGAWALDQSWHLFFGVFVPALIIGGAS